ncbi:hypothetical protein DFR24_3325 [Panacagrimonas perspica]|uniref:CDP-glycerol glycerophosphotransferase (TagB/SpsB family) n=1 Tax=Panacagrimonas perspica TaxID=381431 RepID=A0A4R7P560_9GAMM|nr:sensor domain-containing protein [Panacagrimonas perspica]TDU28944.1 hypothetical protein DFR24_3325 [Panacagrimonas perspica]THD02236.1 hypothetical protein B1810_14995 [Panacagrimonas perspica]
MRIVFPYLAQPHQIPHSLPIAIEMARRYPQCEIHIAYHGHTALPFIRRLVAEYAPDAPLHYDALALDPLNAMRCARGQVPWKQLALLMNRDYFASFDAIATPERTSLFLRRIGVKRPRMIWTRHGAGDREVGFSRDVNQFDFVLMAGHRIEQRLLERGLIRPGAYATGVYAKFDWLRPALQPGPRLFDNARPTVLYNPHFSPALSSWPRLGMQILEHFAQSGRYNLIFAPHVRLFDPPRTARYKPFARFMRLPHLRIDLGSERSIDMSYTRAADLYLGDVSSQVAEFIHRPRPCLFVDAHAREWQADPNFAFWNLGPVTRSVDALDSQIDGAFAAHANYEAAQRRYFEETFELPPGQASAAAGADAIVEFLQRQRSPAPRMATTLALT